MSSPIEATRKPLFHLTLSDGSVFVARQIVRKVPGNRLVVHGVWSDQEVFVKLFLGARAKQHSTRDQHGVKLLIDAQLTTPPILFSGQVKSIDVADTHLGIQEQIDLSVCPVLVFKAITHANNAEDTWLTLPPQQKWPLLQALVETVAAMHNANLVHHDLYLKNFLSHSTLEQPKEQAITWKIFILDGDGVKHHTVKELETLAFENLAVLISKLDVLEAEQYIAPILECYASKRSISEYSLNEVREMSLAHRRKVVSHYSDKKVFRTCTDVFVEQNLYRFIALASEYRSMMVPQLMQFPDDWIHNTLIKHLKKGNTSTVTLNRLGHEDCVVKRYNIKNLSHAMSRALRPSRAFISWSNAHRMRMYGFLTPKPIALIENRFVGIRRHAYFLSEYIESHDVRTYFQDTTITRQDKQRAVEQIVTLFNKLVLLQIVHGDLKYSNIKIVNHQPMLIDLDSLQEIRLKYRFLMQHKKELHRFFQNWSKDDEAFVLLNAAFKARYRYPELLENS